MKKYGASIVSLTVAALVGGTLPQVLRERGVQPVKEASVGSAVAPTSTPCGYVMSRVGGLQHVSPLLSAERACESPRLDGLRTALGSLIDGFKSSGNLTSASVYVYDLQQGDWTGLNALERYDPGSMMKVPLLLTYLSMADETPGILGRTWTCDPMVLGAPYQSIAPERQAQPNMSYTVARLLELMIVYSDNRATAVLLQHVPPGRFVRTYTDLGLPAPVQFGGSYLMNVKDYSAFMKALYNSSLLSPINSGYALELMSRSTWSNGLLAGIPPGVEVAHKFGEAVDAGGSHLHETGLVYAENRPYLVTVMTCGPQAEPLPEVISAISALVYDEMTHDDDHGRSAQQTRHGADAMKRTN